MLGVLIVEDEALSRMELKAMIDWEREGFHILGEAENGKTGLEMILRERPDVVITDIKMPVMDGLEMIRVARRQCDGTQYIVLSSYEEFALLKTAMQYGVADYLLKLEYTPEILRNTLSRAKKALLRDRDAARGRELSPASKAARALRRALTGQSVDGDIAQILALANPAIDPGRLSCIAVRFSLPRKSASFGDEDRRTMEMAAHSIVNDITKQYFAGVSFPADTGLCLFVYTPDGDGCGKAAEMGEVIIDMLRHYLNMASAVGITGVGGGAAEAVAVMEDAVRATDEVFYLGYGKVIRAGEHGERAADTHPAADWSEPLLRALEFRRADEIRAVFGTMLGLLSARKPPTKAEAYGLCFSTVGLTLSALKKNPDCKGFFHENLYEIIGEAETLAELREWLASFQASVLELFESIPETTGDDYIVKAAKRYILENCRNPISLNTVANHLSISSGYLSSVFKRRANVGFVEYVTKVRIAEAKNLLLSGNYKIYEVSELVGYDDPSYFIKTFHKVTGLTPKEYIAKHA